MKNTDKKGKLRTSHNSNEPAMGIFEFLKALYRYLRPYRLQTLLLLVLLLINTAFLMGWPLSFKFLIDKGIEGHNWRVLIITLSVLTVGVLIASAAGVARGYLYAYLSSNVLKDIRQKVFEHLQQLSMSYYKRTTTGDIMFFLTDICLAQNVESFSIRLHQSIFDSVMYHFYKMACT